MRLQKFRQDKMLKYQALRRKTTGSSFNYQINNTQMNGFNSNKKLNPLIESANLKSESGGDERLHSNFDSEKTNGNNSVKSSSTSNGINAEVANNLDTSGANKISNESLIEKSNAYF